MCVCVLCMHVCMYIRTYAHFMLCVCDAKPPRQIFGLLINMVVLWYSLSQVYTKYVT